MGVKNKYHASNEISSMPSRLQLLKDICEIISHIITEHVRQTTAKDGPTNTSGKADEFQRHFHAEPLLNIVLDFMQLDNGGVTRSYEGRIKHRIRILDRENNSQRVFAIWGIGGVGKSTILKGLATDGDLQQQFCDGIDLLTLGKDATVAKLFRELCRILRDSGAKRTEERIRDEKDEGIAIREALLATISWFRMRRCALLIDDIWTSKINLQLFWQLLQLGGPGQQSTVVFTTREVEITSIALRDSIFHVCPRQEQGPESRKILFCHANFMGNSVYDKVTNDSITEVLSACSGLPVNLAAAGKGVKMLTIRSGISYRHAWKEFLRNVRNYREQLIRENVIGYGKLYETFGASLALLEGSEKELLGFETPVSYGEMYRRLCVLRKQQRVPAIILRYLWELNSEEEARVVGMQFADVSLAESGYCKFRPTIGNIGKAFALVPFNISFSLYERIWCLQIHDALHDYATAEAERLGDKERAHEILFNAFRRSNPGLSLRDERSVKRWAEWWSELFEDSYCDHLDEAPTVSP